MIDDLTQADFRSAQADFLSYKSKVSTGVADFPTFTLLEDLLRGHLSTHTLGYMQHWYSKTSGVYMMM